MTDTASVQIANTILRGIKADLAENYVGANHANVLVYAAEILLASLATAESMRGADGRMIVWAIASNALADHAAAFQAAAAAVAEMQKATLQ